MNSNLKSILITKYFVKNVKKLRWHLKNKLIHLNSFIDATDLGNLH